MTIEAIIADLRALENFDAEVARTAAPKLEALVKARVAAGIDPDGKPWPAKKDGSRPLVNAAKAISTEVSEDVVTIVVTGVEAYHQNAKPGGGSPPPRRMIPRAGDPLPKYMRDVLDESERETAARLMGDR